jgi:hypothetical protein
MSDVKKYRFKAIIFDGYDKTSKDFEVEVTNTPPYFVNKKPADI